MRRIPWRLSLRPSRKGAITVLGIALGVAFALVSFSIATGLERDTIGIAKNHPTLAVVVTGADGAPIPLDEVATMPRAVGVLHADAVDAEGRVRPAIALVGADGPLPPAGTAVSNVVVPFPIDVEGRVVGKAAVEPHFLLPPGWVLVAAEDVHREAADFALVLDPTPSEISALVDAGYDVERSPGLQRFFSSSGTEIARDLLLVVLFSSALAMLFCYEFLRSEVRESRREIGVWRALGMKGSEVVSLFVARAAAIGVAAVWAGWGIAALTMGVLHSRVGHEVFRFDLPAAAAVSLSSAFVLATVIGGLAPSIAASRITVQRSLESSG